MGLYVFLFVLTLSSFVRAQYSFPAGLQQSEAKKILERFGVGFLGKPTASFFQDSHRSQIALNWNWVDTSEISKLGNGNQDRGVQYQEIQFSQELPFQVELGLRANLLMLNSAVSTYGGFVRWTFANLPFGALALRAHGSSANYRNLMAINFSGGLVEADFAWSSWILSVGVGQLKTTAQFKASVFGQAGSQPLIRAGDSYLHHMMRLSYSWNRWSLTAHSDQIRDRHNSLILGYVF